MSLRGLAVLLALLAAVVSVLIWVDREPPPPSSNEPSSPLVAAFVEDGIVSIDATCSAGDWTLARDAAGWRLVKPFDAEADPRRVHAVLAGLADATALRTVADAGADTASFGLAPPACTVRLTVAAEPAPRIVRLGGVSPVGSERYALAADGRVVLVAGSLFETMSHEAEWFRERRLFPVEAASLTRIAIDRPDGRLELVSEDGIWRIVAPVQDVASATACDSLARTITGLELAEAGETKRVIVPRADRSLRVEVSSGTDTGPHVAYLAAAGIAGTRVAWRDGGALVGLVSERAAAELTQPIDVYRSRRVASFSTPDVRWVTIERGGTSLRVERPADGAAWNGRSGTTSFSVDGERVASFLARLQGLTAVGIEPVARPGSPTGTLAVGGSGGELCRIAFGPLAPDPADAKESIWVTTPLRPGVVFRVLATDLGPIPMTTADWTAPPTSATAAGS